MKYFLLAAGIALFLSSCNPNKKNDDSKIKESIMTYLTTGVDKKDMLKIDSVGIVSVDTLTEKNILKISLDRNYNTLKGLNAIYESKLSLIQADSALLAILTQQKALYEKHGEKYDDKSFKDQVIKMGTDSSELIGNRVEIEKTKRIIDSIDKAYLNADSVAFAAYFVGATIYLHDADPQPGNYIIAKDWKVSR